MNAGWAVLIAPLGEEDVGLGGGDRDGDPMAVREPPRERIGDFGVAAAGGGPEKEEAASAVECGGPSILAVAAGNLAEVAGSTGDRKAGDGGAVASGGVEAAVEAAFGGTGRAATGGTGVSRGGAANGGGESDVGSAAYSRGDGEVGVQHFRANGWAVCSGVPEGRFSG